MNIIAFEVENWERQAFEKPARGAPAREAFEIIITVRSIGRRNLCKRDN